MEETPEVFLIIINKCAVTYGIVTYLLKVSIKVEVIFFIELLMSLILKRYLQVEFRAKICCGNSRQETLVTLHIINL